MTDIDWMRQALALAEFARPISPPNPSVGCVFIKDDVLLGQGFTQAVGSDHAEIQAVKDALRQGHSLEGATAYVTLEPCSHYGRTPPCALRLIKEKVARVVVACLDPNPLVAGRGVAMLKDSGIEVTTGVLEKDAWQMNAGFMTQMTQHRPWVRLKVAMSMDGFTALPNGESQWITGPDARNDGHRYRSYSGAILTGIGTVLADNPQMNVRFNGQLASRQPLKVLVDSHLRVSPDARIFEDGQVLVVCADNNDEKALALTERGAEVLRLSNDCGQVDLKALLIELAKRHINDVHVEAGATLNGALMAADLVDEVLLYTAPKFLGQGRGAFGLPVATHLNQIDSWHIQSADKIGDDVRLVLTKKEK